MTVLSVKQRDMLRAVRAGRVAWRDPYPRLAERLGHPGTPTWHLDGVEAYGGEHHTLYSLSMLGLISALEGEEAVLTQDGAAVLAATDDITRVTSRPTP